MKRENLSSLSSIKNRNILAIIPNALTLSNMLCGFMAIIFMFKGQFDISIRLIAAAVVFDTLDGSSARRFKVSGEFGKEFDSLCDMISFGIAPALLAYQLLLSKYDFAPLAGVALFAVALYASCTAIRLARFNTLKMEGVFMGMPSPAAATLVAGVCWFWKESGSPIQILPMIIASAGLLMVSPLRYPKFNLVARWAPLPLKLFAGVIILGTFINPLLMPIIPAIYAFTPLVFHPKMPEVEEPAS